MPRDESVLLFSSRTSIPSKDASRLADNNTTVAEVPRERRRSRKEPSEKYLNFSEDVLPTFELRGASFKFSPTFLEHDRRRRFRRSAPRVFYRCNRPHSRRAISRDKTSLVWV
ncbi:hypothetical protein PUN28_007987 [Cardiocondyla obscurior]|uniref:Uncharacterized protein n=1 Tax=Cardiocondyla obscurior TaxID=286306 RepID=A0AAW2FZ23_9HYME